MKPVNSFSRHLQRGMGTQANTNREWEVCRQLWARRPQDWFGEADSESSSDSWRSQGGLNHVVSCTSSLPAQGKEILEEAEPSFNQRRRDMHDQPN